MAKKKFLPNKTISNFDWLHGQEVIPTKQKLSLILSGNMAKNFSCSANALIPLIYTKWENLVQCWEGACAQFNPQATDRYWQTLHSVITDHFSPPCTIQNERTWCSVGRVPVHTSTQATDQYWQTLRSVITDHFSPPCTIQNERTWCSVGRVPVHTSTLKLLTGTDRLSTQLSQITSPHLVWYESSTGVKCPNIICTIICPLWNICKQMSKD